MTDESRWSNHDRDDEHDAGRRRDWPRDWRRDDLYARTEGQRFEEDPRRRTLRYDYAPTYGRGETPGSRWAERPSFSEERRGDYAGAGARADFGADFRSEYEIGRRAGYWGQERDRGREGEHRGHGPKGYKRSDERIREDVSDRLADDSWLDASEIEVAAHDGEVTLSGTVDHRRDKRRAEDVAEEISGVRHVQNNLRVKEREGSGAEPRNRAV